MSKLPNGLPIELSWTNPSDTVLNIFVQVSLIGILLKQMEIVQIPAWALFHSVVNYDYYIVKFQIGLLLLHFEIYLNNHSFKFKYSQ